jgi:hypothetical protein
MYSDTVLVAKASDLTAEEIRAGLEQFCGSPEVYRFSGLLPDVAVTEGVKYLADTAGAYWLLTDIGFEIMCNPSKYFNTDKVAWQLKVNDRAGVLTALDYRGREITSKAYSYTSFPLEKITIMSTLSEYANGKKFYILYLPNED